MLPENEFNLYRCNTNNPRHMSVAVDYFNYTYVFGFISKLIYNFEIHFLCNFVRAFKQTTIHRPLVLGRFLFRNMITSLKFISMYT